MSWTEEDVKRIQKKYGDNAKVTLEDGETLNVKIDETRVNRQKFIDSWMELTIEQKAEVAFSVIIHDEAEIEVVKASAEKHGLQLIPIEGSENHYQIVLKGSNDETILD